jgi:hypothetical protein
VIFEASDSLGLSWKEEPAELGKQWGEAFGQ